MKKSTLILLIVFNALSGVYTGFWYVSANNFKTNITTHFRDYKTPIHHEGITIKGFPFTVELVIKNPHAKDPSIEVATVGNWTLGTTIFNTKGWMEISGKTTTTSIEPNSESFTLEGNLRLEVAQPTKHLENFKHLQKTIEAEPISALWNFLNYTTLDGKNLSLTCGTNDKSFIEADHVSLHWEKVRETAPYLSALLLKFDVQGYEMHREHLPDLKMLGWEDKKSYGKTDVSLQARIRGSFSKENVFPLCLEVEKLAWIDAFGSNAINGKFEMGTMEPTGYTCAVSFKTAQEISPKSRDLVVSYFQTLVMQCQKMGILAAYPKCENLILHHWDQIAALIPDHSSRGIMESEVDLTLQVKNTHDWNYDLKKCLVKMAPYEISMKGRKGFLDSKETPFLELQVSNYHQLIQNLSCYYNSWQSLLTSTQTLSAAEMPPLNTKVVNRMTSFIESLSLPAKDEPNDLHIVIQGRNFNDMKIGSLTSRELSSKVDQLVAEIIPEMYPQVVPQNR